MKQLVAKYTIVCRGETEGDLACAFEEAAARIKDGFTSGHDTNDTSAFYFDVSDRVPDNEAPA